MERFYGLYFNLYNSMYLQYINTVQLVFFFIDTSELYNIVIKLWTESLERERVIGEGVKYISQVEACKR